MNNSVVNSIASEVTGSLVECSFNALATAAGFPEALFISQLAKGLVLGLVSNCFNDCSEMTLSINEKKKLNRVSLAALQTFREMAEKDGVVAWEMNINPAYFDYAYEVAEHATLEAIKQSEKKKVDVLGRYYGRQFYKCNTDWQDMHQIITMAGLLTFRQLVLIRMISEGFKGLDGKLYIGNPSACVEVNRLKDYGIWQTTGAALGIDETAPLQLGNIYSTYYSDQICKELMLDRISDDDVQIVIDSLRLTSKGEPQRELTEEEFKEKTTFKVDGEKLFLPGGIRYGGDTDEGIDWK